MTFAPIALFFIEIMKFSPILFISKAFASLKLHQFSSFLVIVLATYLTLKINTVAVSWLLPCFCLDNVHCFLMEYSWQRKLLPDFCICDYMWTFLSRTKNFYFHFFYYILQILLVCKCLMLLCIYVRWVFRCLFHELFLAQCAISVPPENIRKTCVFWRFIGVQKWDIGLKWVNLKHSQKKVEWMTMKEYLVKREKREEVYDLKRTRENLCF